MSNFTLQHLVRKAAELKSRNDVDPSVASRVERRITFLMCLPSDPPRLSPVFGPQHVGKKVSLTRNSVDGHVVRFLHESTPEAMWSRMDAPEKAKWENQHKVRREQRLLGQNKPLRTAYELFSASSNTVVSVDPKVGGTVRLQSGTEFENPLLSYDEFLTKPRTAQSIADRAALYEKWEADCQYVSRNARLEPSLGFLTSLLDEYESSKAGHLRAMYTPAEWSRLAQRLFAQLKDLGSSCSSCTAGWHPNAPNYLEAVTKLISLMFAVTCPIKADSSREQPPKCFYTQSNLKHLKQCKRRLAAMVDDLDDSTEVEVLKRARKVLLSAKKRRNGVAKRWQSKRSKEKAKYDATDRYAELGESDKVAVENWAKLAEDMRDLSSSLVKQLGVAFRKAMPLSRCCDEIETGIGLRTKDVDRHELDEYLDGKRKLGGDETQIE